MPVHSKPSRSEDIPKVSTLNTMAERQDNGPPPLEDPNSVDYKCVVCHTKVNSLCLACLEKALQMTSFCRILEYIPLPDSDVTDSVCGICDNKVKNLCLACWEMAQLRSNYIRRHIVRNTFKNIQELRFDQITSVMPSHRYDEWRALLKKLETLTTLSISCYDSVPPITSTSTGNHSDEVNTSIVNDDDFGTENVTHFRPLTCGDTSVQTDSD